MLVCDQLTLASPSIIVNLINYTMPFPLLSPQTVSAAEIQRLKRRFMKLDKDGSGSIDKEEFLQIPQIANNPLASRMIAIFDEE